MLHLPPALGSHAFTSPTPSPKSGITPHSTWTAAECSPVNIRSDRNTASSTPWADQVTEFYEGKAMSLSSLSLHTQSSGNVISDTAPVSQPEVGSPTAEAHYKLSTPLPPITPKSDTTSPQAVDHTSLISREDGLILSSSPTTDSSHTGAKPGRNNTYSPATSFIHGDRRREIDPSTVFVGNLDMPGRDVWDDSTLRRIFDRYGTIEDVHLVRPRAYFTTFCLLLQRVHANSSSQTHSIRVCEIFKP